MNDNENRFDGFREEADTENQINEQENANPYFSFDFPKPPVYSAPEEKTEDIYSSAQQPEKTDTVFNPYAAPGSTYNYSSANMPYREESANSQQPPHRTYQPQSDYNFGTQPSYRPAPEEPKKKGRGKKIAAVIVVLCLIAGAVAMALSLSDRGSSVNPSLNDTTAQAEAPTTADTVYATTQSGAVDQFNSVIVAEKARPGVVGVMTYKQGQLEGEGSGVLWKEESGFTYVITCAHVINSKGVTYGVMLEDGKTYEAEMVAADTRTDIGVLKVEATGLPLAEIGNSATLKIGEPIYAIGNPGGSAFFGSVTDGIISSIDRSISSTYTMTVIQHSAAINPGNSGGALVNTSGQVVGINSSKIADTEYEGMGFAVPMSIALPVAQSLVQYKYVPNRPKLGIEYASVSSYQLYSMVVSIKGLPKGSLVIAGISADSSLANTEAEVGDLIIGVNGKDMKDSSVLLDLIETGAVGDTLTLTLCRIESRTYKTSTFDVTITLVEDKGSSAEEETTTEVYGDGGYYYGGASDFEDFFNDYFGFGW
ncbi:MAG: trypsin-like peptidase domain-containing protein [Clostridia bacterium]|nr:trypsin-like peptidase domain-containing protein [Clostridia bacterium]